ncbi:YchJ family protein [Flexibacterium corallicola]|uniref:YchJ family protein n=1 Tax=Flexibacterium corallicola TaxID=3037259 RepID=UPI00286F7031|nr:YchJ family metal-binding protein [Pseudovibrio sp. M1P-2-3]
MPETPEQLMRSRYTAYAIGEVEYLQKTLWPARQKKLDMNEISNWVEQTTWVGLQIHETTEEALKGTVHFTARYLLNGSLEAQNENSLFKKKAGRWYYVKPVE